MREARRRLLEKRNRETELAKSERSLSAFIRAAWPVIEPEQPYIHGWHIDAVSEHLEAVHQGQITRLLINVPPGTMKSLAVGVFFPAWEWGPRKRAALRFLGTSHSLPLAIRDNLKMRRLIESEWYTQRYPHVQITSDQNAKGKFENTTTGFREAMAFTGMTGSRGDRVLIDDPLSVDDAMSDLMRDGVNSTFREALPTRLNNPDSSAIIVVMQRLHENDVAGLILEKDFGYVHLMLPMEFEPERRCVTVLGFTDPRTEVNELLFPARFPRVVVDRDKKVLGPFATAGQFQQRPAPAGGGMFKKGKARMVEAIPAGTRFVRGWDFAATEERVVDGRRMGGDSAYTAGVKIGETPEGRFIVVDVMRARMTPMDVDVALKNTATGDGRHCIVDIPTDPGQAGKDSTGHRTRLLRGFNVQTSPETGSKAERASPFSSQWEAGNVDVLQADWTEEYLAELYTFPRGKYMDQVDASSRAFNQLSAAPKPMRISDTAARLAQR